MISSCYEKIVALIFFICSINKKREENVCIM